MNSLYYGDGEFEFVESESTKLLYKNAHKAITNTELWEWLRNYNPPSNLGFLNIVTPEIERINQKMREDPISENHSGASYALTMRVMQYIAQNGYEKFKKINI